MFESQGGKDGRGRVTLQESQYFLGRGEAALLEKSQLFERQRVLGFFQRFQQNPCSLRSTRPPKPHPPRPSFPAVRSQHTIPFFTTSQQHKLTENNKKHKQIIKYKHIIKQINKNNSIKTQKCIDKYPQRCYYKTIKNNKRKTKKKIIQFIAQMHMKDEERKR